MGNARLQGLPQETLNGDPTGVLFDWVNSAFYFSYVGHFFRWCSARLDTIADLRRLPRVPFKTTRTDPLPNPCNGLLQALPTFVLDGRSCHRMGYLFHSVGEYWIPPLSISLRSTQPRTYFWYCRVYRRRHSILEGLFPAGSVLGSLKLDSVQLSPFTFVCVTFTFRIFPALFFPDAVRPVTHYVPTKTSILLHAIRAGSPYGILVWLCSRRGCFWRTDRIRRSTNQLWTPFEDFRWEWRRVGLEDFVLDRGITCAIKKS